MPGEAVPLIDGGTSQDRARGPLADRRQVIGRVAEGNDALPAAAMAAAQSGFARWAATAIARAPPRSTARAIFWRRGAAA